MLRKKYLKKYSDVFKKRLERGDTIRCDPVKIETKKDSNIKPIVVELPFLSRRTIEEQLTERSKTFLKQA